jgi:N6-L-threonylcarbamoyladenine synthase
VALTHLQERTQRAAGWAMEAEPGIRHLVVAGGVAANKLLRSKLQVML